MLEVYTDVFNAKERGLKPCLWGEEDVSNAIVTA